MIYKKKSDELALVLLDKLAEFVKEHPGKRPFRFEFSPRGHQLTNNWFRYCVDGIPNNLYIRICSENLVSLIMNLLKSYSKKRYSGLELDLELVHSVKFFEK